eukprot:3877233-Pleurochrysis_carterae.AAC.2
MQGDVIIQLYLYAAAYGILFVGLQNYCKPRNSSIRENAHSHINAAKTKLVRGKEAFFETICHLSIAKIKFAHGRWQIREKTEPSVSSTKLSLSCSPGVKFTISTLT